MKNLILLSLILFSGAKAETAAYGVIKGDSIRIRADKSLSSKVIGVLKKYDTVTIIGDSEKEYEIDGESFLWYNISYKGKTGWIYGKYVNILPTEPRENKYYCKSLQERLGVVFTKDYDGCYSSRNTDKDNNTSRRDYYLNLSEPGYLYLKSELYNEFCVDILKEVYQYNGDKLKLIMTGIDTFKIHKNYILYFKTISEFSNKIYSIEVYDLNKPLNSNTTSSYDCIFEKVFEMAENTEEGISLQFDYETLTLSVYMEKLKQTVSVLKFRNGVFQP